jgi:hypothetical protein
MVGQTMFAFFGLKWTCIALGHLDWLDLVKSFAFMCWMAQGAHANFRLLIAKPPQSLPSAGPYRDAAPPLPPQKERTVSALWRMTYYMLDHLVEPSLSEQFAQARPMPMPEREDGHGVPHRKS